MAGSYIQVFVKCPFYKYDDGANRVVCEGLTGDDSSITAYFKKKEDFETQMRVFCCENFSKCEIYRGLMTKYEE